jgi:hypothetical protein
MPDRVSPAGAVLAPQAEGVEQPTQMPVRIVDGYQSVERDLRCARVHRDGCPRGRPDTDLDLEPGRASKPPFLYSAKVAAAHEFDGAEDGVPVSPSQQIRGVLAQDHEIEIGVHSRSIPSPRANQGDGLDILLALSPGERRPHRSLRLFGSFSVCRLPFAPHGLHLGDRQEAVKPIHNQQRSQVS